MGGHHQKIHVIDNLIIGERRSIFISRAAKLAEHVLRIARPAGQGGGLDRVSQRWDAARSVNHFVERIFHDTFGPEFFE